MSESIHELPVIVLHDMVVLPGVMVHFDIGKKTSVAAVEDGLEHDSRIFLVSGEEKPDVDVRVQDTVGIGCVAEIKQILRMPDKSIRVMVSGLYRGELLSLEKNNFYKGVIRTIEVECSFQMAHNLAMLSSLKELILTYSKEHGKVGPNIVEMLLDQTNIVKLVDQTAANLPLTKDERLQILKETDVQKRFQLLCQDLYRHLEVLKVQRDIEKKVKSAVDQNQKEYYLKEQVKAIRQELGEPTVESDADKYLKKLDKLKASKKVKKVVREEIARLQSMPTNSSEGTVVRGYIETLLSLPWKKQSKDNDDFGKAKEILEADHYGLKDVKERVIEYLAVRALNQSENTGSILCLVGPPGTGKTSIAKSIARALDKKYIRICLGGVRDEAEIRGHRRTYIGAMPGRIAAALKEAKVNNPLILFDEIDKLASDHKGDPASALLEVLDGEQNKAFTDHYVDLPMDISRVFFICTANTTETIPEPLLDRMEVIEVSSYMEQEKFQIAKQYLVDKQKTRTGLKEKQFFISDGAIKKVISGYTREAGVRGLEKSIGKLCRKAAVEILEGKAKAVRITERNLGKYLGKVKYTKHPANKKPQVGVVRGLAWTSVGGETLEIQVTLMPGTGGLEMTGKLGEVMCESAKIAISYVRSISPSYKVAEDFYEKHDIHIHVPEGAVPKDGPSAGITMATAVLSAVAGIPVRNDLAMTGEVNLRGTVMPIGGLREKVLAAKAAGIKEVLVPVENKPDYEELPEELKSDMEITFVSTMKQVIAKAFTDKA